MKFEELIRSLLGPGKSFVVLDGRQLYTLASDGTVVCFLGDYRKWSPERVIIFIADHIK